MIAEALLLKPQVLLADEPTTALDVTIQAQILDILCRLTREMGTAIVLVTHNLGLVAESAQRVAVMYAGRVVEEGTAEAIFNRASHPYTQGLLSSIPLPGQRHSGNRGPLHEIKGLVPSLFELPSGCSFYPRCPERKAICEKEEPPGRQVGQDHRLTCWLYE